MTISPNTLAHIRYGDGFRPDSSLIGGPADLIAQLDRQTGGDLSVGLQERRRLYSEYRNAVQKERNDEISEAEFKAVRAKVDMLVAADFTDALAMRVTSQNGFVERLAAFWADHFTVSARSRRLGLLHGAFVHQAIRPHLAGNFADMLIGSTTHPAMFVYLDQTSSIGPNSVVGKLRGRGLNENLAREILELHTLGVGSGYTQGDVREFAELLTGLRLRGEGIGFSFIFSEPGANRVLGVEYGADFDQPGLETIKSALRDLALRPETARHIASKLVVHFVQDAADPGLVAHVADAYLQTGADLRATYTALLEQKGAWVPQLHKVKQPLDYMVSAFRAFGFEADAFDRLTLKDVRQSLIQPLTSMGQVPNKPSGPDGWPEDASAWITPVTLAARIGWATDLAREFGQDIDPRLFLKTALGDASSQNTSFLVAGSESKWEGVALALASPEFNRR